MDLVSLDHCAAKFFLRNQHSLVRFHTFSIKAQLNFLTCNSRSITITAVTCWSNETRNNEFDIFWLPFNFSHWLYLKCKNRNHCPHIQCTFQLQWLPWRPLVQISKLENERTSRKYSWIYADLDTFYFLTSSFKFVSFNSYTVC